MSGLVKKQTPYGGNFVSDPGSMHVLDAKEGVMAGANTDAPSRVEGTKARPCSINSSFHLFWILRSTLNNLNTRVLPLRNLV